jgi:hypothetical protein
MSSPASSRAFITSSWSARSPCCGERSARWLAIRRDALSSNGSRSGLEGPALGEIAAPSARRRAGLDAALAQPLDVATRWRMEQAFGVELSGVSIRRDSSLATGATRALVKDGEIHFRRGTYEPGTPAGDRLIAHELAHVVQLRAGTDARTATRRELEREADRAATLAALGRAAPIALRAQPGAVYAFSDDEDHDGGTAPAPAVETAPRVSRTWIDALAGSAGRLLPSVLRKRLESALDADLGDVRIHDGSISDTAARDIHARAFTLGKDIHFAQGQYDPETRAGQELIAHEVAHTAQNGAIADLTGATMSRPDEHHEIEAERFARVIASAETGSVYRTARIAPAAQIAPVALGSVSSPVVHRDVGWAGRGPIPDPYGMGYNQIVQRAGTASERAVRDLASCEDPTMNVNRAAFYALTAARRRAVLALQPHAAGTACEVWFTQLRASRLSYRVSVAIGTSAVLAALREGCPVSGDRWSATGALTTDGDPDLTREVAAKLDAKPDNVWLAAQLRRYGPEPLWPPPAIEERARRAGASGASGAQSWGADIGVQMDIPDREAGEAEIAPIQVFFVPGRSGRRALVVGGVHGTEHQGVEVVEQLHAQLAAACAAGNPPFFSTVLVPTLIKRSDAVGRRHVCGPGSSGVPSPANDSAGAACADGTRAVEPNRTFPGIAHPGNPPGGWMGQRYQDARRDGLRHQATAGGRLTTPPARRMIAETRALIALIEHFQPERIASVHAHSVPGSRGDGPGVFVDPRGGVTDPVRPTRSGAATADGQADDQLARAMLTQAEVDLSGAARADGSANPFAARPLRRGVAPLRGNQEGIGGDQVHYSASHPTGTSLGDWAPSRGITTVTIEVPQGVTGDPLTDIETMHSDLLQRVFLAEPALATPGAFGAAPAGLRGTSDAPPPTRVPNDP